MNWSFLFGVLAGGGLVGAMLGAMSASFINRQAREIEVLRQQSWKEPRNGQASCNATAKRHGTDRE